jgi:hypothetical protein
LLQEDKANIRSDKRLTGTGQKPDKSENGIYFQRIGFCNKVFAEAKRKKMSCGNQFI